MRSVGSSGELNLFESAGYDRIVIDTPNVCARYYHGMSLEYHGRKTSVVYGLSRLILKFWKEYPGAELIFLWEGSGSRRKDMEPLYKANRLPKADGYSLHLDEAKRLLQLFGVSQAWYPTLEADDLAGWFVGHTKGRVLLVSMDVDWCQFLEQGRVSVLSKNAIITASSFTRRYKYLPALIPLVKALSGDSSDNIKGIPGFGEQKAASIAMLCQDCIDVLSPAFYEAHPEMAWALDKIWEYRELVRHNLELIKYQSDWIDLDRIAWVKSVQDAVGLEEFMLARGMKKTVAQLRELSYRD